MAIHIHPDLGTLLICDFAGMQPPEMVKRRPVVVISPRLRQRGGLCTVVPLSTTPPQPQLPYHYRLLTAPALPAPFDSPHHWVKADMVYTVSHARLSLPFAGKDSAGKRLYEVRVVQSEDLRAIRACVLHGLGLGALTQHL